MERSPYTLVVSSAASLLALLLLSMTTAGKVDSVLVKGMGRATTVSTTTRGPSGATGTGTTAGANYAPGTAGEIDTVPWRQPLMRKHW